MQMKVVESVADEFQCETHGTIQNTVDQMQVNFHQNQALAIHRHRQPIQHRQQQLQQPLQQAKRNRAKRVNLRMVSGTSAIVF